MLKKIKDRLYYYFAEKNWGVIREFYPYLDAHPELRSNRLKRLWVMFRLNWHYRVLRRTAFLFPEIEKPAEKKSKLPFLDGSESSLSNRRKATGFARELLKYDVVSFDIFDTLILRPFSKPVDLFMIIGKRLNRIEFYRIRIDAERQARDEAFLKRGNREITIYDIYAIIEERTGIPAQLGIQTELQVELDYCFANPFMKRVYRMLQEQKKTIVITSDMYLPQELMEKLLNKAGYSDYDKLYVSCDYGCSKRSGGLYEYVKRDFAGKAIVHIGDRVDSDIKAAEKCGLATRWYKNCNEIGRPYRADGMSSFVESSYSGIVNTHLHNGEDVYSPYYEYGFIYGGLYILGFCNWIHNRVKQEGIDKILFLSRDGDIYQKVFNMLFDDVPNEYFLWSRIANTIYTTRKNREDFLRRIIYYRALGPFKISITSLLDSLHLNSFEKYLSQYGLSGEHLVLIETVSSLDRLFIDHWEEVCQTFEPEKKNLKKYIDKKIAGANKIAVIDVGWLGSGPLGLKYLIEEEFNYDCHVFCLQAASRPPQPTDTATELMDGTIETYIFSNMMNRNHYDVHNNTNNNLNNIFFELFSQATYPSYAGVSEDGGYRFDFPEVENYRVVQEIQRGILDFCSEYNHYFRQDPFALNISGYDAYCPYRMMIRDLTFIKKYFSEITFARNVSGDVKNQRIETIGELLDQAGL